MSEKIKINRKEIITENTIEIPRSREIHRVTLIDEKGLENDRKEDNCKVSIVIRKGNSSDKKYKWFPYWGIEFISQEGNKTTWIPTKDLIISIFDEFLLHETRIDNTRDRKEDLQKYQETMKNILLRVQQKLNDFEIPKCYKRQEKNGKEN